MLLGDAWVLVNTGWISPCVTWQWVLCSTLTTAKVCLQTANSTWLRKPADSNLARNHTSLSPSLSLSLAFLFFTCAQHVCQALYTFVTGMSSFHLAEANVESSISVLVCERAVLWHSILPVWRKDLKTAAGILVSNLRTRSTGFKSNQVRLYPFMKSNVSSPAKWKTDKHLIYSAQHIQVHTSQICLLN